ncbi:hypothetical protein AUP68_03235 [Ilyonectria robusta]
MPLQAQKGGVSIALQRVPLHAAGAPIHPSVSHGPWSCGCFVHTLINPVLHASVIDTIVPHRTYGPSLAIRERGVGVVTHDHSLPSFDTTSTLELAWIHLCPRNGSQLPLQAFHSIPSVHAPASSYPVLPPSPFGTQSLSSSDRV